MIDEATAVGSAQYEHRWRRYGFVSAGVAMFVAWNLSTLLGATAFASAGSLVHRLGIDAAVPAAFLALLWPRLASTDQRRTALVGAALALALVPITPAGVPVIAASLGVAAGWRRGRAETPA
jgi:predicted branched-subunit amino acid permease